jgi:hypothetical protein
MDPDALWKDLVRALHELQAVLHSGIYRAEVIEHLQALIDWLRKGGFPPNTEA